VYANQSLQIFGTVRNPDQLAEKKMNFPHTWDVLVAVDFNTALPRAAGQLGAEVIAQVRPNGRILDHYRVTLGGSKIIDVKASMAAMALAPAASSWVFRHQVWPKDVVIRRNMTTGPWINANKLIEEKNAWVETMDGVAVPEQEILEVLPGRSAAVRFAVAIGEDQNLELVLQTLPAAAEVLMGKPAFRGYVQL
jgi:hypothetical protein